MRASGWRTGSAKLSLSRQALGLSQHHRELFKVLANRFFQTSLVEASRGMIHRHANIAILFLSLTVDRADLCRTKELGHRVAPQCHYDQRLDSGNLAIQIIVAGVDLLGEGITIVGGTTLHHIRNKDIRALKVNTLQQLIEELAGGSHKRPSLLILMVPWPFTDEEDTGIWRTFAWDSLCSSLTEATLGANRDLRSYLP